MQKLVYEYAVIRVVPRVEREEFINVGVVLFCKYSRYLRVDYKLDENRLLSFSADLDCDQLKANLDSFVKICEGGKTGGPIALEDKPERFRWLTALRSSVIQTSRPHPGMANDLDAEFEKLFKDYIL